MYYLIGIVLVFIGFCQKLFDHAKEIGVTGVG